MTPKGSVDTLSDIARWIITSAYTERDTGDPDCPNYRVGATVKGPEQREPVEVVPTTALVGVIEVLRAIREEFADGRGGYDEDDPVFKLADAGLAAFGGQ